MKAALYTRVSTKDQQDPRTQLEPLRVWAAGKGFEAQEYVDVGWSGAKQSRPALDAALAACRRGEVQVLAVVALDRLARSTAHAAQLFEELHALGVELVSLREAIDTRTPSGRALMQMAAVFAELERSLIVERIRAGLARAKVAPSLGKRRPGRPRAHHGDLDKALAMVAAGASEHAAAKAAGVPRTTLRRRLRERRAPAA
jgi:DNA invertase Pin-like site-specific DNA recombinase